VIFRMEASSLILYRGRKFVVDTADFFSIVGVGSLEGPFSVEFVRVGASLLSDPRVNL
jgi:hypothetical protein